MAPQISVNVEADRGSVALVGEHEAYTADKLAKHLRGLLDEGVPVVIDLRHATFLDSTVIGVLLASQRRAHELGLDFVLRLGDDTGWPVRRLLEVTGLEEEFDVLD